MYYITIHRNNPLNHHHTTKYLWFNKDTPQQSDLPRDLDYYPTHEEGIKALEKAREYSERMSINSNGKVVLWKVGQDEPVQRDKFGKIIMDWCPSEQQGNRI